jgi:ribose transport system permease protein
MGAAAIPGVRRQRRTQTNWREIYRAALPVCALAVILIWIAQLQPDALSYGGLNLLLSTSVPLLFATAAQMLVVMIRDIDLGIGPFVGLVNVVAARYLDGPVGWLLLVAAVAAYGGLGALIHWRRIPSIVATLGASFVWFGIALLILPSPGGTEPSWLASFWSWNPPLVPLPILLAALLATGMWLLTTRVRYGVVLRGAGADPQAVARAGWSPLRVRVTVYALAGLLGVLAGLATTAITATGDANSASGITLLTVAAVVLGGGEFSGGIAAPFGAAIGAVAISLVGALLSLLSVSSDYQSGVQGAILLAVLAGRAFARRDA